MHGLTLAKSYRVNRLNLFQWRAVVFDVDGTLINSNDAHAYAFMEAFHAHQYSIPFKRVRPLIGMGAEKLIPLALEKGVSNLEREEISATKARIFETRYLNTIAAFPGAHDLLRALNNHGLGLAIATSASGDELQALLHTAGLEGQISLQACASDAQHSKPDPDIVLAAIRKLDIPRSAIVMIGDTPYDAIAAKQAGIAFVGFTCGGWSPLDLAGALKTYSGPQQLFDELNHPPHDTAQKVPLAG